MPAPGHVKPNAYTVVDDQIAIREGDQLKPLVPPAIQTRLRIRGLIKGPRDAVRECFAHNWTEATISRQACPREIEPIIRLLCRSFRPDFRPRQCEKAFKGDPDLPLLLSLENYDEEKKKATKDGDFSRAHHSSPCADSYR
jgi:hypothetical protein